MNVTPPLVLRFRTALDHVLVSAFWVPIRVWDHSLALTTSPYALKGQLWNLRSMKNWLEECHDLFYAAKFSELYAYVRPDQQKASSLDFFLHWLIFFCHLCRQYTFQSPITWLEDEDFFLSVLESFLLSVLHSFLSPGIVAPSKLDFDLGK
jgi:hypothetical protein